MRRGRGNTDWRCRRLLGCVAGLRWSAAAPTILLAMASPIFANHLALELQDFEYDFVNGTSTWSYEVVVVPPNDPDPGISHATLELDLETCAEIVECSPSPCGPVVDDPSTGVTGIKWDQGSDFPFPTYSVTLNGTFVLTTITYGIKAGQEAYTDLVAGPDTLNCVERCTTNEQCNDGNPCSDDSCNTSTGGCVNVPGSGSSMSVFEQTVLGRGYCEFDPVLSCLTNADCVGGACVKAAFEWVNPLPYAYVIGDFVTSTDIGFYPFFFSAADVGTSFIDAAVPPPGAGFYYLTRPDCPAGGSWRTAFGAEPGRDPALP